MLRSLGFQVPFAERVRREANIATMAVGIILEAQHAETILENGQADLIAVGRQSQYNPNIFHRRADDLGINARFEDWAPEAGGLRSGSERWMALRHQPAPLLVAHESRAGGSDPTAGSRHPGFVCDFR